MKRELLDHYYNSALLFAAMFDDSIKKMRIVIKTCDTAFITPDIHCRRVEMLRRNCENKYYHLRRAKRFARLIKKDTVNTLTAIGIPAQIINNQIHI